MTGLTRTYVQDHMTGDRALIEATGEVETAAELGEWLEEAVLAAALEQFTSKDEERQDIEVTIIATVTAQATAAGAAGALGGCIKECFEVKLPGGIIKYERCKHVSFKGQRPGPG